MAQIDLRNSTITFVDGSGSNSISVKIGEGNLTYDERRNIEPVKRRGTLSTVREGDEEPVNVEISFVWEYITSTNTSDPPTVEDVLKRRGPAASWTSSSPDVDAPYCVDITIEYEPPCLGEDSWELISLSQFHYNSLRHSLKDGTVDMQGLCNQIMAEATRVTPS